MILIKMRMRCSRAFWKNRGIQSMFLDTVKRYPDKTNSTVQPGDVIAICMENGAHFVAAWLACAKIGVISAWINTNLQGESLLHSLKISKASVVLCSAPYQQKILDAIGSEGAEQIRPLIFSRGTQVNQFVKPTDTLLPSQPTSQPTALRQMTFQDPLCYIFTSGTTGMPKPAVIKHFRYFYIATSGECAFGIKPKTDRIYICLPLYHTSAGVLGECFMITTTASEVSQYIGELLRYLLLTEKSPFEENHNVRLLIGNGLRPAIWREFQERFKVERIAEFYGSTEGTSNLINIDGKEGSCGFMTIIGIAAPIYPIRLFKVDEATGELIRDERGYCIPIRPGESGILACTIRKNNPLYHFEGYVDDAETQKKVIQEPLPGSDPVFLSGDILYWDKLGYFYFKDRIGDTFRWKGENVSTTQVEAVLQGLAGVQECTVYGVEVPGCEGRAGMAAITQSSGVLTRLLLTVLYQRFTSTLPAYAVPCFVRITEDIDKTATFKMKKSALQSLGISNSSGSTVYYLDHANKTYTELTDSAVAELEKGRLTL
ncbi:AMP-binding enzyme [Ancylostoma caninum]|uniref:long-chain-fatty-acid--CoA ligase n=1 Tax=Ancylostoma caninum TaxID=29170 RepID=A0A368GVI7_ANCCA|nr:AMP-binding enzyme [Ancylostoma caninum]